MTSEDFLMMRSLSRFRRRDSKTRLSIDKVVLNLIYKAEINLNYESLTVYV